MDLAPIDLPTFRNQRYQGEAERVTLKVFVQADQQLLADIYGALLRLYQKLKVCHDHHRDCRDILTEYIGQGMLQQIIGRMSHLGHATVAGGGGAETGRMIHDLRGGAFQTLAFRLQLFELAPEKAGNIQTVYFLVRDHLKIMRNCVADLDPERFKKDSIPQDHDAQLLVEKWSDADFHAVKRCVHIELECYLGGTLCESCLEFASVDRIVYNLMNNAARHTADGRVYFYVLPVPDSDGKNVRFVLANRVPVEHRARLAERFGDDLGQIFRGGFTTGGNGLGLRICADFCAHAYGIFDFEQAKEKRLLRGLLVRRFLCHLVPLASQRELIRPTCDRSSGNCAAS